jgi:AP-1 complex subunit mu
MTADLIVENYDLIHDLMDELMDFGYPQILDPASLGEVIPLPAREKEPPCCYPSYCPCCLRNWMCRFRPEGLEYGMNELFADVREEATLTLSKSGRPIESRIIGKLNLSSYLSGMPEVEITFNDRVLFQCPHAIASRPIGVASRRKFELEDLQHHGCVRFGPRGVIQMTAPPDGEWNAMTYRVSGEIVAPVKLEAEVGEKTISLKAQADVDVLNVTIVVPLAGDEDELKAQCSAGQVRFDNREQTMVWVLPRLVQGRVVMMHAELETASHPGSIIVTCQTDAPATGLRIARMKVMERSVYYTLTWVRYSTDYRVEFRV